MFWLIRFEPKIVTVFRGVLYIIAAIVLLIMGAINCIQLMTPAINLNDPDLDWSTLKAGQHVEMDVDFVMGAYLSKGGKSFICMSSTFQPKGQPMQSRIRPTLAEGSIATDTRTTIMYLVTEYGKVNLKGLNTWQRAEAIISVAHPDFRDQLIAEAEKMHIWRRSNRR